MSWLPITRPPGTPRIACSTCEATAVNTERALKGWTVSAYGLRRFRCPSCSEPLPFDTPEADDPNTCNLCGRAWLTCGCDAATALAAWERTHPEDES